MPVAGIVDAWRFLCTMPGELIAEPLKEEAQAVPAESKPDHVAIGLGGGISDEMKRMMAEQHELFIRDMQMTRAKRLGLKGEVNPLPKLPNLMVDIRNRNVKYNGKDIFDCAQEGDVLSLYVLVIHGVDLLQRNANGATALHVAACSGRRDVCAFLLEEGVSVDVTTADEEEQTPLMWAAMEGHLSLCAMLVSKGADVRHACARGRTALVHAAAAGRTAVVHYFAGQGLDADAEDFEGHSALTWACYKGQLDTAQYLVERQSAKIGRVDKQQRTMLHWAARQGHMEVCEWLIRSGVDWRARDGNGKTALEYAKENKNQMLAAVLTREQQRTVDNTDPLDQIPLVGPFIRRRFPNASRDGGSFMRMFLVVWPVFVVSYLVPPFWLLHMPLMVWWLYGTIRNMKGKYSPDKKAVLPGGDAVYGGYWTAAAAIFLFFYMYVYMPWLWPTHPVLALLMLGAFAAGIAAQWLTMFTDPPYIRTDPAAQDEYYALAAEGKDIDHERQFCRTTKVRKPLRSKFDRSTGKLVARFDHHCPWMAASIGQNNHKIFYVSLVGNFVVFAGFIPITIGYVLDTYGPLGTSFQSILNAWVVLHPLGLYFLIHSIAGAIGTAVLLKYHTSYIWNNITTNEDVNKQRYESFLQLPNGKYLNSYDLGPLRNCLEFWGVGHTRDWTTAYDAKHYVDRAYLQSKMMRMGFGPGSQAAGGGHHHH